MQKDPRYLGEGAQHWSLPARHAHPQSEARRRRRYLHAGDDAQEAEDDEHVHEPRHVPQ